MPTMGEAILLAAVLTALGVLAFRDAAPFRRRPAPGRDAARPQPAADAATIRRAVDLWRSSPARLELPELEPFHDEAAGELAVAAPIGTGCGAIAASLKARVLLRELSKREAARLHGARFELRPAARPDCATLVLVLRLRQLPQPEAELIRRLQGFGQAARDWRATHWPLCREALSAAALCDRRQGPDAGAAAADDLKAAS